MFHKAKLPTFLITIILLVNLYCIGQNETDLTNFQFKDKYGCIINVQNLSSSLKPIDSFFLKDNITSHLILHGIDTLTTKYDFSIYNITFKKYNTYEIKIELKCEYKENSTIIISSENKRTKNIGQKKTKRICGVGVNIYSLTIKRINDEYKIDKFIYLYSEI
jgi:hypothetical protein